MLTTPHFVLFLSTISRVMFLLQGQFWGIKVSAATFHLRNVDRMNYQKEFWGRVGRWQVSWKKCLEWRVHSCIPSQFFFPHRERPQLANGMNTIYLQYFIFLASGRNSTAGTGLTSNASSQAPRSWTERPVEHFWQHTVRGVLKNKWIRLQPMSIPLVGWLPSMTIFGTNS